MCCRNFVLQLLLALFSMNFRHLTLVLQQYGTCIVASYHVTIRPKKLIEEYFMNPQVRIFIRFWWLIKKKNPRYKGGLQFAFSHWMIVYFSIFISWQHCISSWKIFIFYFYFLFSSTKWFPWFLLKGIFSKAKDLIDILIKKKRK